jgi:urease accessory protein
MDQEICSHGSGGGTKTLAMISDLHIITSLRGTVTYLKKLYFTAPFKVADVTENKRERQLHLTLMSSSPGILDSDEYRIKIELESGSAVRLYTQAYQRLFNMKNSASQHVDFHMGKNSSLYFLPHPVVPHAESNYSASNRIYLEDNCCLIYGEILTCGRKLNGELFKFSRFHNLTEIFLHGKLVIRENLLIEPSKIDMNAIGQLEGFTHQASMIYLHEQADPAALTEKITQLLAEESDIQYGVSAAPVNGVIVRIMGKGAEQLMDCLHLIAENLDQMSIINPSTHGN